MEGTQVDDEVDTAADHLADNVRGQIRVARHCQHLESAECHSRPARMQGGEAAVVAAGHGMEHVHHLPAPDLTVDHPPRPLPQGATLEKILKCDATRTLDIGVALFQADEAAAQLV